MESCRGYSVCGIAGMNAVAGRRSAAQGNISFSIDTIIVPNGLCESSAAPDLLNPLSARRAGGLTCAVVCVRCADGENEMMNHP